MFLLYFCLFSVIFCVTCFMFIPHFCQISRTVSIPSKQDSALSLLLEVLENETTCIDLNESDRMKGVKELTAFINKISKDPPSTEEEAEVLIKGFCDSLELTGIFSVIEESGTEKKSDSKKSASAATSDNLEVKQVDSSAQGDHENHSRLVLSEADY